MEKIISNSFYNRQELLDIGFNEVGYNVMISRKASIYSPHKIKIGSNVRIDDFCVLSGEITIRDYIHISAFCGIWGGESGVLLDDYCTISSRTMIYAVSDDYSGKYMTNPLVPDEFRNVVDKKVCIERFAIIGSGCTILPGIQVHEGASVGAMSLINKDLEAWNMYVGVPVRLLKKREKDILSIYENHRCEML